MSTPARLFVAPLVAAALLAGCGDPAESVTEDTLAEAEAETQAVLRSTLEDLGLTSLATAFADLGIDEVTDVADYTFFAPSDAAFLSLSADDLADLVSDRDALLAQLRRHVVETPLDASALEAIDGLTSASGDRIRIDTENGVVTVGGAPLVASDHSAGEAVIHIVDGFVDAG